MSLLLVDATQWILLGVLGLIIVLFPIYAKFKNKKDSEAFQQLQENIKKGDKIITTAGVIGKVVSIKQDNNMKLITIETGDEKHKGYLTIDSYAVGNNLTAIEESAKLAQSELEQSENNLDSSNKTAQIIEDIKTEANTNQETEENKDQEIIVEEQPSKKQKSSKKTK